MAHELACRLEGRNLSKAEGIDRMIAEYMSGEGGAVLGQVPEPSEEEKEKERDRRMGLAADAQRRRDLVEMKKSVADLNDHWAHLDWSIPEAGLPESLRIPEDPTPGDLDRWMRRLVRLEHGLSLHFMECLELLVRKRLYYELTYEQGSDEPEGKPVTFRMWLPAKYDDAFFETLRICQQKYGIATIGMMLEEVADSFIEEYGPVALEEARKYPIHERDRYECANPVCTVCCHLEDHHYRPRSRGGSNKPENRGSNCHGTHQRGIHLGYIAVSGRAPHGLTWMLGVGQGPNGQPHMTIRGRRIIQEAS